MAECHLSCFPPAFEAAEEAATEYYDCVKDTDDYTEIQRYEVFECELFIQYGLIGNSDESEYWMFLKISGFFSTQVP